MKIYSSFVTISLFFLTIIIAIFVLFPQVQDYRLLKNKVSIKREELSSKEYYFSDLRDIQQKLDNYKEQLSKIDSAIPSNPNVPLFLAFLEKTASENGLIVKDIGEGKTKKLSKETQGSPNSLDVSISLKGTYESFKNFLSAVEKNARLINIENIDFSSPESEKDSFTFNLKVKTYFKNYLLPQ